MATASTYMNFVYDPTIAAQLALGAGYIVVGQGRPGGGREARIRRQPQNTLVFPTDGRCSGRRRLHQNDPAMLNNPDYIQQWEAVPEGTRVSHGQLFPPPSRG